jgi:multiple sugar transport system permease protein
MLAVAGYPVLYAVWLSLQRYDLRFPAQRGFVGLGNYAAVLSAPVFWSDLVATAVITAIAVTAELVLGFAIALTLRRGLAGRRAVHAALLLPYGIITVVAAFAWQYLATPDLSFLTDRAWLGERWSSFAVVIATEVWKSTPFVALLLLAGLAAVPEELMDTARVDGASAWQRFHRVLLPGIRPVLLVVLLYRVLDSVRVFDTVFIQTNGANGTETVSLLAYDQLAVRLNLGLGSAVSVLLFLLAAAIALGFVWVFRADLRELSRGGPR